MANPRKFSEKIALHNQKQAEETAKFEQIMREVSDVKVLPSAPDRGSGKHTLRINQSLGSFRGGSLPNVSAGGPKSSSQNKDTIHKPEQDAAAHLGLSMLGTRDDQPPQITYRESRNRSMGVGPMRPRAIERRIDTSPYSGPYLSPPPDTSWRRTHSDSALHQSAMQNLNNEGGGSRWNVSAAEQNDGRPRSSCDVPRVPGINIYPSAQEPGIVQIPIGNNTGSLPDLTSVHFPSPLHTPIDQDGDHSSSPYSSSPVSASPATLSPTSVPTGMRSPQGQAQFQFTNRPMSQHHNTNHLSVPMNSRFLHHNKGVTLENSITGLVDGISYTQTSMGLTDLQNMYQQPQQHQQQQQHQQHQQQHQNQQQHCPTSTPSPTQLQQPASISGPGYRSPMARPSPQSSPGVGGGGRHSAPSSPAAAPSPLPDYLMQHFDVQANMLQQTFKDFSMDWAQLVQSLVESGCTWSAQVQMDSPSVTTIDYMDQPPSVQLSQAHTQTLPDVSSLVSCATDLNSDPIRYYTTSPSSVGYPTVPTSLHTTPNTPTSIPDIIFTDFSNTPDDLNRQDSLDEDLFPSDESLREGLGSLDPLSIQMLSHPDMNVISDSAEDYFRLDRL